VLAASLIQAAGLAVLAFAPTMAVVLAGAAISGVALGVFVSVELALAVEVLPDPTMAAKDLGVYNITNAAPQSLARAIGPAFIAARELLVAVPSSPPAPPSVVAPPS
jgi:predicted MFS family arabinose efflux permease